MSEREIQPDSPEERPLFQAADEQEQVYAPQQTSGSIRPAADDADSSASADPALGSGADHSQFIPVRPSTDANYPAVVPASSDDERLGSSAQRGD